MAFQFFQFVGISVFWKGACNSIGWGYGLLLLSIKFLCFDPVVEGPSQSFRARLIADTTYQRQMCIAYCLYLCVGMCVSLFVCCVMLCVNQHRDMSIIHLFMASPDHHRSAFPFLHIHHCTFALSKLPLRMARITATTTLLVRGCSSIAIWGGKWPS